MKGSGDWLALAVAVRRATLAVLLAVLLLFESPVPVSSLLAWSAVLCGAITIWRLIAAAGHRLWWGYGLYLLLVAMSALAVGLAYTGAALLDQIAFVVLAWSVADEAGLAGISPWVAGTVIGLALLVPQLAGPRSGLDYGRAYHYQAVQQWGGYPELGVLLLMGLVAAWAFFAAEHRRPVQLAWLGLSIVFAAGLFVVLSRAALAVAPFVAIWIAAVAARAWRRWVPAALILAAAVAGGAIAARNPDFVHRVTTASTLERNPDRPLGVRQDYWWATLGLIGAHPWLGVGPGQYARAYARTGATEVPQHAHNLPLHVAAETGLAAAALYLVLWGRTIVRSLRAGLTGPEAAARLAVHAMLAAFFLRSLADHFLAGLDTSARMLGVMAFLFGLAEARVPAALVAAASEDRVPS